MNWKEIKQKYPKAYNILYQKYLNNPESWNMSGMDLGKWELRDLYDFFDEQGLRIFIKQGTMDTYLDFDIENRIKDFEKESVLSWEQQKADRQEIEIIAFTKAFEILENIISN